MAKKINGNGDFVYGCEKFEESSNQCEINFPNCKRIITRKVTINNHPCAGEQKICDSPSCLQEAKQRLKNKYKSKKQTEGGRNKKHRAA